MSETKPKRFHRYVPETLELAKRRASERFKHGLFKLWRERIDARPAGSIAFAPEAK